MIDPATGWFEVKDVVQPDVQSVMVAFDDTWLCRYPRPQTLGFDGGSEYKAVFDEMCKNYDMKKAQSAAYNPQSNGVIERVHQVLNNCLSTANMEERELDARDPWGSFLAATAFPIRSTFHTTTHATPGQLVFQRDMILPIQFKADWALIHSQRQQETERNNTRENRTRIPHEYKVGEKILLNISGRKRKHGPKRKGPYLIEKVYDNGTLRIRRGHISDRVNIRRVLPYFE